MVVLVLVVVDKNAPSRPLYHHQWQGAWVDVHCAGGHAPKCHQNERKVRLCSRYVAHGRMDFNQMGPKKSAAGTGAVLCICISIKWAPENPNALRIFSAHDYA